MIRPLHDYVVVEMIKADKVSKGGIVMPEGVTNEKLVQAKVLAVGPGRFENGHSAPMSVSVGDVVLLDQYSPRGSFDVDGKVLHVVGQTAIYGIV